MKFNFGIELTESVNGIIVRQHNQAYLAKRWSLSRTTIDLVNLALESGLTCMIRERHPTANALLPNGKGTVYLAFSQRASDQWAVAIDSVSTSRTDFRHAVFNGKLHEQFLQRNIPFAFESRNTGSGHLVVDRARILQTIKDVAHFDLTVLSLNRLAARSDCFANEYDIQRAVLRDWASLPFGLEHSIVQAEFPVDGGLTSRRLDVLAQNRTNGDWLVIEIKRAAAQAEAVAQLSGYLLALGKRDDFNQGRLVGALLAERIPQPVREIARNEGIQAYEVAYPIKLARVA